MRSTRILTAAALAASSVVLSAGAAGAQEPTPNPDIRSMPTGPACAENVLKGSVRASVVASTLAAGARPTMTVQLRWSVDGKAFTDASVVDSKFFYLTAGTGDYAYSLSAANVPSTAKSVMAYAITHAGSVQTDTLQSKVLSRSACDAAPSTTTITRVELSCSGDVLSGQAVLADPPSSGTVPGSVAVQSRASGATLWSTVAPAKNVTVGATTTTIPYEVSIAGKHAAEYRTRASVNNGAAIFSPIVLDTTCAPAAVVPEAPAAVLIPLTLAATAGAVAVVRRRRSTSAATATASA